MFLDKISLRMQKQINSSLSQKIQKAIVQKGTKRKPIYWHEDNISII